MSQGRITTIRYSQLPRLSTDRLLAERKLQTRIKVGERLVATLTVLGCMISALLISQLVLIKQSLRLDESQSIWQATHTITGLLHTVALDVHVPLYHLLLHYWMLYLGDSVSVVRLLSLTFFLASIPVVYLLARQILGFRWSLVVVLLFSFSPFMNWYANEARMYTLLVLVSALNQLFFLKLAKSGRGWFGFTTTALIGVYTHYFFVFSLVAEGIFYLLNRSLFKPGTFKRLIAVGITVSAALLPWLYYFHKLGSGGGTRPHLPRPSSVDFFNVYSQFLFGFQSDRINTFLLSAWPIAILLVLLAVRKNRRLSIGVRFMAAMAVLPVALAFALSLFITPFFLSRYMVAAVAPLLIVIAWLFSQYSRRYVPAILSGLFVITLTASFQQATSAATPVKENYRGVADYLNQVAKPQDLIVLSAPFTVYPFEYYYHGQAQIQTLPIWDQTVPGNIPAFNKNTLPQQVAAQNANHRNIYLVLSQDQGYEKIIKQYYLTHFKQLEHRTYSPDLTLYVYKVGYYSVRPIDQNTQPVQ